MLESKYEITINANIYFEYYSLKKQDSNDCQMYIDKSEIETYDEFEDIKMTITPKMLLDCIDFVYADSTKYSNVYKRPYLIFAFEENPFYFQKICAEIFNEENIDYSSKIYDYLIQSDEFKQRTKEIVDYECSKLGELYAY